MNAIDLYILTALGIVTVALSLTLLLRRTRFEIPRELNARIGLLEQAVHSVVQATARNEGLSGRLEQQLQRLSDRTVETLAQSREVLDQQLSRTIDESRNGRAELINAFEAFEGRLEQRIGALDASLSTRFEALQQALDSRLDEIGKALLAHLAQAQSDAAGTRQEIGQTLATFRNEISGTLKTLSRETTASRETLTVSANALESRIQERFEALTTATRGALDSLKADIMAHLGTTSSAMRDQLASNGEQMRHQFATLQETLAQQLLAIAQGTQQSAEQLRTALNERLAAIQQDNTNKLEEMRRTVDEKLHATLEQRLGDSFKLVSERLEMVHTGLGEMKNLAGSVGDLKRVMTNVRARGSWGEMQLGQIIEGMLTPDQYARNVKTVPGSNEMVEYAVCMPGPGEDAPVWLPIDSKYPVEPYQKLLEAHESLDKALVQQATAVFESSIRAEAKKISSRYLNPPHTTDFAFMFLPTEGLFAEVARVAGLLETLQNEYRVVVAGPTTLQATLSSLRLGFRTLAIGKRSSEVWALLGTVKTEFGRFGEAVKAAKRSIDLAAKKFDDIDTRTRAINRKLTTVQELPESEMQALSVVGNLVELDEDNLEVLEPTETVA